MSEWAQSTRRTLHPSLRKNLSDLDMVQYGTEACAPGHSFGPAVRDHWLIHVVRGGKGRFVVGEREWTLHAGDGFLICPDQITWYGADWEDPWQYAWIGFSGSRAAQVLLAAGLDVTHPIFHTQARALQDCLLRFEQATQAGVAREHRFLGALHLFFADLIEGAGPQRKEGEGAGRRTAYVKQAEDYFRMNYARSIGIADAAAHVGLDRSYFSEIFRMETGIPPRDFLIGLRMEKACRFMQNPALSIADIARSVGYEDPLLFSKIFRKHQGLSPSQFKKERLLSDKT